MVLLLNNLCNYAGILLKSVNPEKEETLIVW
jgi:hypothetical protein